VPQNSRSVCSCSCSCSARSMTRLDTYKQSEFDLHTSPKLVEFNNTRLRSAPQAVGRNTVRMTCRG
jgi:hypothetical protein